MQIKIIIREKQPEIYLQLIKMCKDPYKISRVDILECMSHGAWKRGHGGALKQIRR